MKLLACGAGRITDELLKRVGLSWQIILIDKDESRLSAFPDRFPGVVRVVAEDASSPVVLERAGIAEQDCVLALTNDDRVNLAVSRFAQEAGVNTVLAVVRDPETLPKFRQLGIWTVTMASDAARRAYQFIKDPRIRVVSLGKGEGELLELAVEKEDEARLAKAFSQEHPDWRVAGLFRNGQLIFADSDLVPVQGDRLLILGKSDLYTAFSGRLAQTQLHFPRTYGRQMLLCIENDTDEDAAPLLNEAFYLARATHVEKTRVVFEATFSKVRSALDKWSQSLEIETVEARQHPFKVAARIAGDKDVGLVMVRPGKLSFIRAMFKNPVTGLAARLPCPLLCARQSDPYETLLVAFNGSLEGQRALEIALDLAHQLDATVSAIVVIEPDFLKGDPSGIEQWKKDRLTQIRDLARVHKTQIKEQVAHGNPVKEIAAATADCGLLVLGVPDESPGIFSVDVVGMIVNRVSCSVLLV